MAGFLLINPRSGTASPGAEELAARAEARGIRVHVLSGPDDPRALAQAVDADALGVAGGDGSLAWVAAVAAERRLPFVCVPFGSRNHFARDLGLDRDDPFGALAAFEGEERRVDLAFVNRRPFLNNVSLGVYARLVHRREHHRRRREALARLRALPAVIGRGRPVQLSVDGDRLRALVVLVANNAYTLEPWSIGERDRLDEGRLHLYVLSRVVGGDWHERVSEHFRVEAEGSDIDAAVDGEPERLRVPMEFTVEARSLRVLVARG